MSAEHDHRSEHAPAAAEPFPRHATSDLVGAHMADEERRARIQAWLVALGLVLLALAFPCERLIGSAPSLPWQTTSGRFGPQAILPSLLAEWLTLHTLHLPASRAWFLLAALAYGASFLVLLRSARALGWNPAQALFASLLACLAPISWLAGTNPGASAFALLGSCVLFTTMSSKAGAREDHRRVRIVLAFLFVIALNAQCVWFLPAVSLRMGKRLWFAVGIVVALPCLFLLSAPLARQWFAAGYGAGPGPLLAWASAWLVCLGAASVGLISVARAALGGGATAPAPWVFAFALVPFFGMGLFGTLDFDLPYVWLVPVGWLGLLHGSEAAGRRGAGLRIAAALLGLLLLARWIALDPERSWREPALAALGPKDLVLTASGEHERILRDFHELATLRLSGPMPPRINAALHDAEQRGGKTWLDEDSLWRGGTFLRPDLAGIDEFAAKEALPRLPAREKSGRPLD